MSSDFGKLFDLAVASAALAWWSVGVVVLEAWAAVRADPDVRASSGSSRCCMPSSAVAVTLYLYWPFLEMFHHVTRQQCSPLAIGSRCVIPVSVFVLANRNIAPTARARFGRDLIGSPAWSRSCSGVSERLSTPFPPGVEPLDDDGAPTDLDGTAVEQLTTSAKTPISIRV